MRHTQQSHRGGGGDTIDVTMLINNLHRQIAHEKQQNGYLQLLLHKVIQLFYVHMERTNVLSSKCKQAQTTTQSMAPMKEIYDNKLSKDEQKLQKQLQTIAAKIQANNTNLKRVLDTLPKSVETLRINIESLHNSVDVLLSKYNV